MQATHQPRGFVQSAAAFSSIFGIKLDAHRVVKDFALYLGDLFHLIDQHSIFNGVLELSFGQFFSFEGVSLTGFWDISKVSPSWIVGPAPV